MSKKKRGGTREGAGRSIEHPEGKTIPLVASVPKSLVDRLVVVAEKNGWNRSQSVTEAVRLLLKQYERKKKAAVPSIKSVGSE